MPVVSSCRRRPGRTSDISCASCRRHPDSASSSVISCSTSCEAIRNAPPRCVCRPGSAGSTACALDGELDVAQVPVSGSPAAAWFDQLLVRRLVQRREVHPATACCGSGDHVLALRGGQVVAVRAGLARRRSLVNATPVPLVSPRLPNTMVHTFTRCQVSADALAAPVEPGPVGVQELNTARMARSSCSRGCCGNSAPVCWRTASLNDWTRPSGPRRPGSSRSPALGGLALSSASRTPHRACPSTVLPEHLQQPPVGVPGEPPRPLASASPSRWRR